MTDNKIKLQSINVKEALRYLGYGNNEPDERTKELLPICSKELLDSISPQYVYRVFDLTDNYKIEGADFELKGDSIKKHLSGCKKVIMMCATLSSGADLLIRKKQLLDMAQAVIVDSMASAAIEQVCDEVEMIIKKQYSDYEFTWRFGPGYGDFPIELQDNFLNVLNAPKLIGVCTNGSSILTPTKSVTCIIGMGHNLKAGNKKSCENCNLRETCRFRKKGKNCGN